jgi:hypothetical protein
MKELKDEELLLIFENNNSLKSISEYIFGYYNGKTNKIILSKMSELGFEFLTLKEKYEKEPKLCKTCKSVLLYDKRNNNYCNNSCAAKTTNLGQIKSIETKNKISKTLTKKEKTNKIIKKRRKNEIKIKKIKIEIYKKCIICDNEFLLKNKTQTYCSVKCLSKRVITDEIKEKIRQIRLKEITNGTHQG